MEHSQKIIGILGGMGSYSTLHTFKRILDLCPGEKEWDRPRILIDNNCKLPSRVRSILYKEKQEELINRAKASLDSLVRSGAEVLLVPCNTMHFYYDQLASDLPGNVLLVNMIELGMASLSGDAFIMASEGTVETRIYDKYNVNSVSIQYPTSSEMPRIRTMIECVKQNDFRSPDIADNVRYIHEKYGKTRQVVLGCTELSMLANSFEVYFGNDRITDPLEIAIRNCIKAIGLNI